MKRVFTVLNILTLILLAAVLLGGASWTTSQPTVTVTGNVIHIGNTDIEVDSPTLYIWQDGTTHKIFIIGNSEDRSCEASMFMTGIRGNGQPICSLAGAVAK